MTTDTQRLLTALKNLAASSDEQAAYLEDLGVAPSCDELALDLEDSRAGLDLPPDLEAAVKKLDSHLDRMSGEENARLWQVDALETAGEWEVARQLAAKALQVAAQRD